LNGLRRERRLRGLVAGAVEADDEPVADQLVRPRAGEVGEVLDALGVRRASMVLAAAAMLTVALLYVISPVLRSLRH